MTVVGSAQQEFTVSVNDQRVILLPDGGILIENASGSVVLPTTVDFVDMRRAMNRAAEHIVVPSERMGYEQ